MKDKQYSVSLSPDLREWVDNQAKKKAISKSAVIRQCVKEKKEKEEKK